MLDKIDKGTAMSIGLVIAMLTVVFAAGVLYSQVQRNMNDISIINSRLDVIGDAQREISERITSVETKIDILIERTD